MAMFSRDRALLWVIKMTPEKRTQHWDMVYLSKNWDFTIV
jgi:hypothetical protein